jgi:dephospho-CoA kinase
MASAPFTRFFPAGSRLGRLEKRSWEVAEARAETREQIQREKREERRVSAQPLDQEGASADLNAALALAERAGHRGQDALRALSATKESTK